MKSLPSHRPLFIGILLMFLGSCSGTYEVYHQAQGLPYTYTNNGKAVTYDLRPAYESLDKGEPLALAFRYSQNLVYAEKLKSVRIQLFSGEGTNGPWTREWPVESTRLDLDYWDGTGMVKRVVTNFTGDWSSLIDPSMKHVTYRESKIVGYGLKQSFKPAPFPAKVLQVITLDWADRPVEVRTNFLIKAVRKKKAFIEGRPFG